MPSTGHVIAGSGTTSGGGNVAWTNPGNVTANDGTNTTSSVADFQVSQVLRATSFGLAVGANIEGIIIDIDDSSTITAASISVWLTKDGTNSVGTGTSYTTTGFKTLGSSTDLWGTTWSESEIEASTFGVLVQATGGDPGAMAAVIDYISVNVFYNAAVIQNAPETIRIVSSGARFR